MTRAGRRAGLYILGAFPATRWLAVLIGIRYSDAMRDSVYGAWQHACFVQVRP